VERETGIEPATSSLGIVLEMLWLLILQDLEFAQSRHIPPRTRTFRTLSAPL